MGKKAEKYLEKIIKRNPDLSIENNRRLDEDTFVAIGRELLKDVDELYLTSHSPHGCINTSYRLWIEKPYIRSDSGHPDWYFNSDLGVVEMWKEGGYGTEEEIFSKIKNHAKIPDVKIVGRDGWFAGGTKLYKIK